jgi:thiamine-phosphate pyrophosphorylase
MVIVISNPTSLKDETLIINQLFDEGLEFFHLRKPGCSLEYMHSILKEINSKHHSKVSLHQHHELADTFGLNRLHYTEESRRQLNESELNKQILNGKIISSSIHNAEEYKTLSSHFDYAFFGPVFNSISKSGYNSIINDDFKIPDFRKTKMIALGGIDKEKINRIKKYGFDGIGVLGNIWIESKNAVSNFKNIKKEWER